MARKIAAPHACGVLIALASLLVSPAQAQSACDRIIAACEAAGFVRGGASAGNGVVIEPGARGEPLIARK